MGLNKNSWLSFFTLRGAKRWKKVKGQTFLIDMFMFLAASMFVVLLFLLMLSVTNSFRMQGERMQKAAENAADILVSNGDPVNWESNVSDVHILGLADRRGRIEPSKLAALNQTEYLDILSLSPYNASIKILQGNSVIYSTGWFNSSARVVVVDRIILYNGQPSILRIQASEELQ